jgi:CBS domain containing-hemolysin-like protein
MEAVLLSTPQSHLHIELEKGHVWAKDFLKYKNDIDKPLSAILSLNTVAHTVGAAGVGAEAVKVFGEAYFGLISAILTILILVLTEIIPKTIGALYWKGLSKACTNTLKVMIIVTYPLVWVSSLITKVIGNGVKHGTTSREEIAILAGIGATEGIISENEFKVIQNIIKLKHIKVNEIMTPRIVVTTADQTLTLKDFLKNKDFLKFSRIPIYADHDENIMGYVFREMVFEKLAEGNQNLSLSDIARPIFVVPNSAVIFNIWEQLLEKKEQIALVVDEYGGMDGIVTMEDIIETLLGLEILDEKDTVGDMQHYARERWKAKQLKYNLLDGTNSLD